MVVNEDKMTFWDETRKAHIESQNYSFVPEDLEKAAWYITSYRIVNAEQRREVWEDLSKLGFYEVNAFRDCVLEEIVPDANGSWAHDYVNRAASNWIGAHAYKAAEDSVGIARESVWTARVAIVLSLATLLVTLGLQIFSKPEWPPGSLTIGLANSQPLKVDLYGESDQPFAVALRGTRAIVLPPDLESAILKWLDKPQTQSSIEQDEVQ